MQVGAHKEARKETEEKLNEISERVTDAELAYQHTQLAEDLAVRFVTSRGMVIRDVTPEPLALDDDFLWTNCK